MNIIITKNEYASCELAIDSYCVRFIFKDSDDKYIDDWLLDDCTDKEASADLVYIKSIMETYTAEQFACWCFDRNDAFRYRSKLNKEQYDEIKANYDAASYNNIGGYILTYEG